MPWRIAAAQSTYGGYLEDGRLPWHPEDIPEDVTNAFGECRQLANKALERSVLAVSSSLSLPCRGEITQDRAMEFGLDIPGEIDLIVADVERTRLWVCEVKDVYGASHRRRSPAESRSSPNQNPGSSIILSRRDQPSRSKRMRRCLS